MRRSAPICLSARAGDISDSQASRMVTAAATFGVLYLLFAIPAARAEEVGKFQDRVTAEAIVVDPNLNRDRLIAAACHLREPTITFETRVDPNISILTRVPATTAQR